MAADATMQVGVIVERREIDNPWQDHVWAPVAVLPAAPPCDDWQLVDRGEGWARYFAATLPLELFRGETEAYRVNLSGDFPSVWVHLRDTTFDDAAIREVEPFLVTASPFEAEEYLEGGEDIIGRVPMPDDMIAWVQSFIDQHHIEQPFVKRRRRDHKTEQIESDPFVRHPSEIPVNRRPREGRDD